MQSTRMSGLIVGLAAQFAAVHSGHNYVRKQQVDASGALL
jgi:hypothetical protein